MKNENLTKHRWADENCVKPVVLLPVMVQQHVDQVLEESWLCRTEEAVLDLVHSHFQFWQTFVVFFSVVAVK